MIINEQIVSGDPVIEESNNLITKEISIVNNSIDTLVYDLPRNIEININPALKGKEYLMIEGEDNIINAIKTDTTSNALDFTLNGMLKLNKPLKVVLHTSQLKRISSSGIGKVFGLYEGNKLRIMSSGTGEIHLAGSVDSLNISVSGTGHINCKDLQAKNVDLSVSGTANAQVYASDSADIGVSGIGKIKVYGSPEEFTQHISGLGKKI